MKINVAHIIKDHISTFYSANSKKVSKLDLVVFYFAPFLICVLAYYLGLKIRADAYSVSITVFGISIALLLNIQVAIFSIFQRKWTKPKDTRLMEIQAKVLKVRRVLLNELNANISYLILVCCVALFVAFVFYVRKSEVGISPAIVLFLYIHFLLTVVMVVKRSHALFQKEYRDSPD